MYQKNCSVLPEFSSYVTRVSTIYLTVHASSHIAVEIVLLLGPFSGGCGFLVPVGIFVYLVPVLVRLARLLTTGGVVPTPRLNVSQSILVTSADLEQNTDASLGTYY